MYNKFHPSKIVDELYNAMDEVLIASDIYEADIQSHIINWFETNYPKVEIKITSIETSSTGGTVVVSWCENSFPQMEVFNFWY